MSTSNSPRPPAVSPGPAGHRGCLAACLGLPWWYDSSGWRRKAADSLYKESKRSIRGSVEARLRIPGGQRKQAEHKVCCAWKQKQHLEKQAGERQKACKFLCPWHEVWKRSTAWHCVGGRCRFSTHKPLHCYFTFCTRFEHLNTKDFISFVHISLLTANCKTHQTVIWHLNRSLDDLSFAVCQEFFYILVFALALVLVTPMITYHMNTYFYSFFTLFFDTFEWKRDAGFSDGSRKCVWHPSWLFNTDHLSLSALLTLIRSSTHFYFHKFSSSQLYTLSPVHGSSRLKHCIWVYILFY